MCKPKTFIGCYSIAKCEQYGCFKEFGLGNDVELSFDENNDIIFVRTKGESQTTIGELQVCEADKKAFLPLLHAGNEARKLYICKLSHVDNQENKYRVSIWASKIV